MTTPVVFRKFDDGAVIAIFPQELGTNNPYTCGSYMQVGQHGSCDPSIVQITTLATPEEYAPLLRELQAIGYDDLIIRKRITRYDLEYRKDLLADIYKESK